MNLTREEAINQIDTLLTKYEQLNQSSKYPGNLSDIRDKKVISNFVTSSFSLLTRIAGANSVYINEANRAIEGLQKFGDFAEISILAGSLSSLRSDIENGHLTTFKELIHAEMFGDFLEMAEHLLDGGYKDAAAVMIGSVLEIHIKKMCEKNDIGIYLEKEDGSRLTLKTDRLNADLAKKGIYSGIDQKSVTSWYGLRNDAAHGKTDNYSEEQAKLMLHGVTDFISRNPA